MEIAIGVILSGVTELIKVMTEKWGKKLTTAIVYGILAIGAAVYAILQQFGIFATETWAIMVKIMGVAVLTYEMLVKRIAQSLIGYKTN